MIMAVLGLMVCRLDGDPNVLLGAVFKVEGERVFKPFFQRLVEAHEHDVVAAGGKHHFYIGR